MSPNTHTYVKDSRNDNIKICINGKYYSRKNAKISVFDSGFLLGDGVWEGIRLLNGYFVFLEQHINRLFFGARELSINIGLTKKQIINLLYDTILINNMKTNVHIRLIVSRGLKKTPYQHPDANVGCSTIVVIPEYKKASEKINKRGLNLITVQTLRGPANIQNHQLNTLSKQNCISACIEAMNAGADEGLMLDIKGYVATCNSTNFFIIMNKEVWTSTGEFCLPGVTRSAVISLCKENNIPVFCKNFKINDVYCADEAFVTGTFGGIIPVINVDNTAISNNSRGPITYQLQNLYKNKLLRLYPK